MGSLLKIVGIIAGGLLRHIIGKPATKNISTRQRSNSSARNRENVYRREQTIHEPPQVQPAEAPPVHSKPAAFCRYETLTPPPPALSLPPSGRGLGGE